MNDTWSGYGVSFPSTLGLNQEYGESYNGNTNSNSTGKRKLTIPKNTVMTLYLRNRYSGNSMYTQECEIYLNGTSVKKGTAISYPLTLSTNTSMQCEWDMDGQPWVTEPIWGTPLGASWWDITITT
jgi:hypothetical protein